MESLETFLVLRSIGVRRVTRRPRAARLLALQIRQFCAGRLSDSAIRHCFDSVHCRMTLCDNVNIGVCHVLIAV